jgi:hypothetical protein
MENCCWFIDCWVPKQKKNPIGYVLNKSFKHNIKSEVYTSLLSMGFYS